MKKDALPFWACSPIGTIILIQFFISLTACGDGKDGYVGTWRMRDQNRFLTIEKISDYYMASAIDEIAGQYTLTQNKNLISLDGKKGNISYNDDNDVIVVSMDALGFKSFVFDRASQAMIDSIKASKNAPFVVQTRNESPCQISGRWAAKYNYYAGYKNVTLNFVECPGDSANWYRCTWKEEFNLGGQRAEYHWMGFCSEDQGAVIGTGDMWRSGVYLNATVVFPDSLMQLDITPPNEPTWSLICRPVK